jgi:hypothetical protein
MAKHASAIVFFRNVFIFKVGSSYKVTTYEYFEDTNLLESIVPALLSNDKTEVGISLIGLKLESIEYSYTEEIANDSSSIPSDLSKVNFKGVPREDSESIEYNATSALYTNSLLRSSSDITQLFISINPSKIKDATFKYEEGRLNIYYITEDGFPLTSTEVESYRELLRRAYYIGSNGVVINMGTPKSINIYIRIYTYLNQSDVPQDEVIKVLNKFEKRLGKTVKLDEIRSNLSRIQNVNYAECVFKDSLGNPYTEIPQISLDKFIKFESIIDIRRNENIS